MSDGVLYGKLAEVARELQSVSKDGRNEFHRYKYTSAEEMLRTVRGPLLKHKLILMPSLQSIEEREIQTAKGGASTITTVHIDFTFVDGETGQMHKCSWAGQGDDPADKGLGKAYTNAIKTFLREQFLLPMDDDPEADPATDRRAAERQPVEYKATDKQLGHLQADIRKNNPPLHVLRAMVDGVGGKDIQIEPGWLQKLTRQQASGLIKTFESGTLPDPQAQDIPSDFETPEAVPVGAGEELPFDA